MTAFVPFPKMPRLRRECVITEKIDGTNACIRITEDGQFLTGKRTSWVTPKDDNFGFAKWAQEHRDELMGLGVGTHFGEWWGSGIQRRYGLADGDKRFSLFNVTQWNSDNLPACCYVVPSLYRGTFNSNRVDEALEGLRLNGSLAAPGFMKPEGIVCYHVASGVAFKATIEKDCEPKSANAGPSYTAYLEKLRAFRA